MVLVTRYLCMGPCFFLKGWTVEMSAMGEIGGGGRLDGEISVHWCILVDVSVFCQGIQLGIVGLYLAEVGYDWRGR